MKTQVQALVTRFNKEIIEVQPLVDENSIAMVVIAPESELFKNMQEKFGQAEGNLIVLTKEVYPNLDPENPDAIQLKGPAKVISFKMGDVSVAVETMTVNWKKDK